MQKLTVQFSGSLARRIRDYAQAQGITYASLVRAAVQRALNPEGPIVLRPFGMDDLDDCRRAEDANQ